MHCVKIVIQPNCGNEASILFQHLVQAHVPTSGCQLESDVTDKNSSSFAVTYSDRILFYVVISFCHLTIMKLVM